jgi:hypothetical protein
LGHHNAGGESINALQKSAKGQPTSLPRAPQHPTQSKKNTTIGWSYFPITFSLRHQSITKKNVPTTKNQEKYFHRRVGQLKAQKRKANLPW